MPPITAAFGICNYLLSLTLSHFWFAIPQLVLQADWQEVWHSPQPPFLALSHRLRVSIVLICSIISPSIYRFRYIKFSTMYFVCQTYFSYFSYFCSFAYRSKPLYRHQIFSSGNAYWALYRANRSENAADSWSSPAFSALRYSWASSLPSDT